MKYNFSEQDVIVKGEYDLAATLTIPETSDTQKKPAIVIIVGSGKADRNGNLKGFNMNIYRLLAQFLAGIGFVTIRYDKRGIAESKGDPNQTGLHDLEQDIISNIEYLESLPYVDRDKILLLGHSEGCILATLVNAKRPVSGCILLSGAGIAIKTAMQAQNKSVVEEIQNMEGLKGKLLRAQVTEKKALAKQNQLFDRVSNSTEDVIKVQFRKFPAKWLREHLAFTDDDILAMLKDASCPILAITGDKDVQADVRDLEKVEALGKENILCLNIKNMDHVLREFQGKKSIFNVKKQYKDQSTQPLHYELVVQLEYWLTRNFLDKQ